MCNGRSSARCLLSIDRPFSRRQRGCLYRLVWIGLEPASQLMVAAGLSGAKVAHTVMYYGSLN